MIKDSLAGTHDGKNLQAVMDHLADRGLMSPEAEYFFKQESSPKSSKVGKIMDPVDRMARQMTQAVEGINRSVIGLSAYKMEKARLLRENATKAKRSRQSRADIHKQAMDYAHDTVAELMGNYSRTNSGHLFNDSRLGAALQFKKYAAKTYTLLGRMTKEAVQGDPAAKKSLLLLLGIQGVAAGALGLPIEPMKMAYTAATGDDADVAFEEAFRSMTSGLSDNMRDGLAHGVTRMIPGVGFDLGSRLGMDNLTGVKLPASASQKDLSTAFGQLLTGASLSTVTEFWSGLKGVAGDLDNAVGHQYAPFKADEFARHAAQMIPIKAASDVGQAVAGYLAPGETKRGYEKTAHTYTLPEALVKSTGFTPTRDKIESEKRNANYVETRVAQKTRSDLQMMWLNADDADHRARVWGKVEEYNRTATPEERITRAQLNAYLKTHERKAHDAVLGQEVHKRERGIFQRNERLFGATR
jgi:hypothetical protein